MTERAQTILTVAMSAYTFGWLTGWLVASLSRRDRDSVWRRSFNRENTNRPSGPPPLKLRRSGEGGPGPTTPKPDIIPKPQPPPGRIIDAFGRTIGYQPLPWDGPTNPPPRNP